MRHDHQHTPHAYVELDFESSGGHLYEKHPDWLAAVAARFAPVPMAVQDFGAGTWTAVTPMTRKAA